MKPIFAPDGSDAGPTVRALLAANRALYVADLYQITLVGGWQSRAVPGFVARWTDKDYPIRSTYLEQFVGSPVQWPTDAGFTGTFYPQRMKRGQISQKLGFQVSTLNVEVFTNDIAVTDTIGFGPVTAPLPLDLSIPSYRDAFAIVASDNSTVAQTLKQAAWKGDLDQAYFFIFRAFFSDNPQNLARSGVSFEPLGVMPFFTGYIKQTDVTRLSVKFTVGSLIDIFTTTQTPTQVIESGDRGGNIFIPTATIPQLFCNIQSGSTPLVLIGDGAAPNQGITSIFDEPHFIPPTGPFTITVDDAAKFFTNIRVRDASTGNIFGVGSGEGHYNFNSSGVYGFASADANTEVAISYEVNQTASVDFTNGWILYNYGSQFNRPDNTPVIRAVYAVTLSSGHNTFFLMEPLPIAPQVGDTFTVYQQQPLDATSSDIPAFPFVSKPENVL